ncbi:MAG: hypothetical protein RRZ84_02680 [Romboutsia sp.]
MYNFISLIFSAVTMLSAIAIISCACLASVTDFKYREVVRCIHLCSQKVFFCCLFIGGCIHLIF